MEGMKGIESVLIARGLCLSLIFCVHSSVSVRPSVCSSEVLKRRVEMCGEGLYEALLGSSSWEVWGGGLQGIFRFWGLWRSGWGGGKWNQWLRV